MLEKRYSSDSEQNELSARLDVICLTDVGEEGGFGRSGLDTLESRVNDLASMALQNEHGRVMHETICSECCGRKELVIQGTVTTATTAKVSAIIKFSGSRVFLKDLDIYKEGGNNSKQ